MEQPLELNIDTLIVENHDPSQRQVILTEIRRELGRQFEAHGISASQADRDDVISSLDNALNRRS